MIEFDHLEIASLIREDGFQCSCGKTHRAGIRALKIGDGVLASLPEVLKTLGSAKPMVIAGPHTFPAAGQKVCGILEKNGIPYSLLVLEQNGPDKLQPDEEAVREAVEKIDPSCDLVVAVGSGSVNDVCKAASTKLRLPQLTVGTAPSMDGYVSASASLELRRTKSTVMTNAPAGVILDTSLIEKAPMRLLWAGVGDIAAKVTALCEWKIVSLILNEDYCGTIAGIVRRSIDRTFEGAEKLLNRDPEAVTTVAEGLVLSGLCMNFAGNSRPASGLEHYFSHCWEMMRLAKGEPYDLHGIYVGIGTLIELKIMEKLIGITPTREQAEKAAARFDPETWKNRLFRLFGDTAEGFLKLEEKTQKNAFEGRMKRVDAIIENWDAIRSLMEEAVEEGKRIEPAMVRLGMPVRPSAVGFSAAEVRDAFIVSRDVRDKYLLSSLIWDIGLTDEFASWLECEYADQPDKQMKKGE